MFGWKQDASDDFLLHQLPESQYEVCDPGSEGGKRGMRNIPNDTGKFDQFIYTVESTIYN